MAVIPPATSHALNHFVRLIFPQLDFSFLIPSQASTLFSIVSVTNSGHCILATANE
jgi:hypothetical protein